MRISRAETKACLLGSALLLCSPLVTPLPQANAATPDTPATDAGYAVSTRFPGWHQSTAYRFSAHQPNSPTRANALAHGWQVAGTYGISCVPYAREASGILVAGNAWQWWDNASGRYARGDRPEPGSVLTFRSNGRMRLGHVAVVRKVVNPREIIVDHANWPSTGMRGGITHNVAVVDISEANNWSAVRVQLSKPGEFGSVYPTYGFIYNRPDNGVIVATVDRPAPQPAINKVPSDLRPPAERPWHTVEEVAESPVRAAQRIDLRVAPAAATP